MNTVLFVCLTAQKESKIFRRGFGHKVSGISQELRAQGLGRGLEFFSECFSFFAKTATQKPPEATSSVQELMFAILIRIVGSGKAHCHLPDTRCRKRGFIVLLTA